MTVSPNTDQVQVPETDKSAQLEKNFGIQRRHYEKQLEQERLARQQAEERAAAAEKSTQERSKASSLSEDDDDDEPYVDKRKLSKTLANFEKTMDEKIDKKAEQKAQAMLDAERKNSYLKQNPDFEAILNNEEILSKFATKFPDEAEALLEMPANFSRQKLVYAAIKSRGLHQPEQRGSTVQEKVDANRKSPYYQPSGVGTAPYSSQGDFSKSGQKAAHEKMKELQARLRI